MSEPRIDPTWSRDKHFKLRPFLAVGIPTLLICLALLLSTVKGCNALGRTADNDAFEQSDESGFILKTNQLLAQLLADSVPGVLVTDMESLHKRYPAFIFALPYGEDHKPVIEASDLRLIGIHPEYIKGDDMRNFYFNSRLPQLLRQQNEQMAETFFEIKAKGTKTDKGAFYDPKTHTRPILITSIKVHASMFKVALNKTLWHGNIRARQNCLFSEKNAVFITYGSSMIPVPKERSHDSIAASAPVIEAVMDTAMLLQRNGRSIDYYQHYKAAFDPHNASRGHSVSIRLCEHRGSKSNADIQISATDRSLRIVSSQKICVFRGGQKAVTINPAIYGGANNMDTVSICDGMKLAVYGKEDNRKLAEFTLHTTDPTNLLSTLIQTNLGTSRYTIAPNQTDLFTQQVVRGLTRHMSDKDGINDINLTLDPMLSLELENRIADYLHSQKALIDRTAPKCQYNPQYDMSVTVMDMATGEVLATPFYTTKFDAPDYPERLRMTTRNVSLSRRYIGSTFKPIIACAAVQANPNLLNLETTGCYNRINDNEGMFFGHKTRVWAANHWRGIGFTQFLTQSDDVYPVALAALAMTGNNTQKTLSLNGDNNFFRERGGWLCLREASNSPEYLTHPFTNWLAYITRANYDDDYDKDGHQDPFHILKLQQIQNRKQADLKEISDEEMRFGLMEVSPDITNLSFNRFREGGDFRGDLVPWVLGQGDNQWSCLTMAQAWARMIGRRDVYASFIQTDGNSNSMLQGNLPGCNITQGNVPRAKEQVKTTWDSFLDNLHAAAAGGTLQNMQDAVTNLNNSSRPANPLILYCKTGTPSAYSRYEAPLMGGNHRYFDIGMFCFALVPQSQVAAIKSGDKSKGIVCIVRITRTYQCKACDKAVARGGTQCHTCYNAPMNITLSSSNARNFFSSNADNLRMLYDMTARYY